MSMFLIALAATIIGGVAGIISTLYTLLNAAEQGGIWLYGYYYKTERAEDPGEAATPICTSQATSTDDRTS